MEVELVDEVGARGGRAARRSPTPLRPSRPPPLERAVPEPQLAATAADPARASRSRPSAPSLQPPRQVQRQPPKPQQRPARAARPRRRFPRELRRRPRAARRARQPAAPTFSATAPRQRRLVDRRQAQRCADRQPYLGEGADQLSSAGQAELRPIGPPVAPAVITSHRRRRRNIAPNMASCSKTRCGESSPTARRSGCRPISTTPTTAAGRKPPSGTG